MASTQGEIYRLDTSIDSATVVPATLSALQALAQQGNAADATQGSANVGQVIELTGSNFGDGTRVLFNVRDASGNNRVVSQAPLVISNNGTRLQVLVPALATTGDVRVVNQGSRNLGFGSYADAVHRALTISFTAGGTSAIVDFGDGGLEGPDNESWGLDNVRVSHAGNNSVVFSDNFEDGSADAAWRNPAINEAALATLSRFGGRFNNATQRLTVGGLTAGQTYTLQFDLVVLDSWDGNNASAGPDIIDVSIDGLSRLRESLVNYAEFNSAQTLNASAGLRLQIVPTLSSIDGGLPGADTVFNLRGSGFMEGSSTVTIGGVALPDAASNLSPFDVTGARNDTMNVVAPRTLDGPIRVTTEGGWAEISGATLASQPASVFSAIVANASTGTPGNAAAPSAATGQTIVLRGQGLSNSTLVQFQGIDDSGRTGTLTRTGTVGNNGTTLSIVVPALARSGNVTVLGSGASLALQIVPTLRAVGGSVAEGNTIVLEGTGLTANDLAIVIDGRGVGSFSVRTVIDGSGNNSVDQQLLTLTVPAGVSTGVITVSTAGGSSTLRSAAVVLTVLADLSPAADVGDTLDNALNPGLGSNQSIRINAALPNTAPQDVDLFRLSLNAGEQLSMNLANSASLYAYVRVFDANGVQLLLGPYFSPGSNNAVQRFTASTSGTYYVGVSGYNNTNYDPKVANSGTNAGYFGTYALSLERLAAGSGHLSAISASAGSGTPTHGAIASANTAQTIVISGAGLAATDRLVFTTLDDNGNLSEVAVAGTVDLINQTIAAAVPANATTGRVRLERDASGLLLQIVPTLSDVTMTSVGNGYAGSNLQLTGSGFAEGASSVLLGNQSVADLSRHHGLDVFNTSTRINLTVPSDVPSGPIRVSTVGGTSAAFGISLSGLVASAGSGTPADVAVASANPGQTITLQGSNLDNTADVVFSTVNSVGAIDERVVRPSSVNAGGTELQVLVPLNAVTGQVRLIGAAGAVQLQIVPTVQQVQVESIAADGSSAQLLLLGTGFAEGNASEYRLGSTVVLDAGVNTGPDVFDRYDPVLGQSISNGYARVSVPISNGVFGAINVKTAGGTSANYSASLGAVASVALSGTPADAAQGSANAGQAITVSGAGLSSTSDILLRWTNIYGDPQMTQLSPTAASGDGSSATVVIPVYANGAFTLQLFGSASQPLLQIVPTISGVDIQDRTIVLGTGLVEGTGRYEFAGASVQDTADDPNNIDVYYNGEQNGSAYLNRTALPRHGIGALTVSTAGGTSAAYTLNTVRVNEAGTNLGDVAVDAAGKLWVGDYTNPGHLLKIEPSSGQVIQTITLSNDYGTPYTYNHLGLQVVAAAMTLGATAVPAGSLLVFNGYANADRVLAVNPSTGAVIATLVLGGNYDLSAGAYDATTGLIFVTENNGPGNRILAINAASGALVGTSTAAFNVQTWSGLAIDANGHLWLGSTGGGAQLVEYSIGVGGALTELRRLDTAAQRINQAEISGLSFDAAGQLWVASTQGEIYRITV